VGEEEGAGCTAQVKKLLQGRVIFPQLNINMKRIIGSL
jgi:hypothetical protein